MTFRRDLVDPRLASWNELLQRLGSIQLVQGTDEFRWRLTKNGMFSVSSMYIWAWEARPGWPGPTRPENPGPGWVGLAYLAGFGPDF
jgi:hypothetical protein